MQISGTSNPRLQTAGSKHTPAQHKRTVMPVAREKTGEDTFVSSLLGGGLGLTLSLLPVSYLVQNGIGGNWGPAVTMLGGAALGAGILAGSNSLISGESVPY